MSIDLVLWGTVAAVQANLAIFVMHLLCTSVALLVVVPGRGQATGIFFTALIARGIFTVLGWYTTHDENRRFFIGTNEDASRFWDSASLRYDLISVSFEDPLFPGLNVLIRDFSSAFSQPAYLAHVQIVMLSGTMMVVFAYFLFNRLYGRRVATLAGYLMACHPIMIAFSTGLMRDALIGMFGFMMLYALSSIPSGRQLFSKTVMVLVVVAACVCLAYLRSISLAGFAIAGFLLLISRTPHQIDTFSSTARYLMIFALIILVCYAVIDRQDRFEGILDYAIAVRAGEGGEGTELNPDGITTRIAEAAPYLFILVSPLALLQPLPFFAWDAPAFIGGPPALMDVVIGFGGMMNQILFGFYVIAVRHWLKTDDTFGVRVGLCFTLLIGTLALIGLGQIRMVMAHAYPFLILGISLTIIKVLKMDARRLMAALWTWLASLAALYLAYSSFRLWDLSLLAIPCLLLALYGMTRLWRMADTTSGLATRRADRGKSGGNRKANTKGIAMQSDAAQ